MFAKGGGWSLPLSNSTLTVCVGGIAERPVSIGEAIARREFLCVAVAFFNEIGPCRRRYAALGGRHGF